MYILSICIGGHDNSITLLKDEKLILFIAEERISKIKHDPTIPFVSLKEISKYTKNIDHLIISFTNNSDEVNLIINSLLKFGITYKKIHNSPSDSHHLFHASSAFYGSGFDEAYCLVMDAFGGYSNLPNTKNLLGFSTTTIFYANYNKFEVKYNRKFYNPSLFDQFSLVNNKNSYTESSSLFDIGLMYSSICTHLGWGVLDGGKLMGLSPYGNYNSNIPLLLYKNKLFGNMNLFIGDQSINTDINDELLESKHNYNTQQAMDLAYSAQKVLEKFFIERINQILKLPNPKNIVLSGGCFMNVVGNYILQKKFPNINFYIDPLATDIGQSYGAAKHFYYNITNSTQMNPLKTLYQGPRYSKQDLLNSIQKYV